MVSELAHVICHIEAMHVKRLFSTSLQRHDAGRQLYTLRIFWNAGAESSNQPGHAHIDKGS